MKVSQVYFFSYGEIEILTRELNLKVNYDNGKVLFNSLYSDKKESYDIKMKELVKKRHCIKEDLTDYAWYCESGDQYWKQPVMLIPSCF